MKNKIYAILVILLACCLILVAFFEGVSQGKVIESEKCEMEMIELIDEVSPYLVNVTAIVLYSSNNRIIGGD